MTAMNITDNDLTNPEAETRRQVMPTTTTSGRCWTVCSAEP